MHARMPFVAAVIAAALAVAFVLTVRLPPVTIGLTPFLAAGFAFVATLAIGLALPARWLWSDAERLHHAFSVRHGLSGTRSKLALDAITTAHDRAAALRAAARGFAEELREETDRAADTLDAAARDIFYDPETLSTHRAALVRSELVEDAVRAHARLRGKARGESIAPQVAASRDKVSAALGSLQEAFGAAEGRAANRLLSEVGAASETAETLLRPKGGHIS